MHNQFQSETAADQTGLSHLPYDVRTYTSWPEIWRVCCAAVMTMAGLSFSRVLAGRLCDVTVTRSGKQMNMFRRRVRVRSTNSSGSSGKHGPLLAVLITLRRFSRMERRTHRHNMERRPTTTTPSCDDISSHSVFIKTSPFVLLSNSLKY